VGLLQARKLTASSWPLLLLSGLSVSIGWGIRGQLGHEYSAALAGALAGMVIALLSGREDWQQRVHSFAFFGAVGIAFGPACRTCRRSRTRTHPTPSRVFEERTS
jgi:hypothetical protein